MIDPKFVSEFEENGYVVARGLFNAEEVAAYREHYMTLRGAGTYPGDFAGVDLKEGIDQCFSLSKIDASAMVSGKGES